MTLTQLITTKQQEAEILLRGMFDAPAHCRACAKQEELVKVLIAATAQSVLDAVKEKVKENHVFWCGDGKNIACCHPVLLLELERFSSNDT